MNDPRDQRRSRLVTAFAAAAGLLVAAAVAVPAAGATADHGRDGAAGSRAQAGASRTKTKKTKKTKSTSTTSRTTSTTTSSRPHCTGCVEHQVFGFEDGSTQRWLPYGKATALVTSGVAATMTSPGPTSWSAIPRTGQRQLTVSGMGNAAGLRWPGTSDTILASFQARVWVHTHGRTGTLRLSISNSYASVSATAAVGPDGWTAITTPTFFGNHQAATISLTQENYCADGDLGSFDLDDTAIASSFTNDPPVWRADDAGLLAAALPQITLSMVPCPSTTSPTPTVTPTPTPTDAPTVLDFEDGTTQGWHAVGDATVRVTADAALDGSAGLRILPSGRTGPVAKLVTPTSAWGGSGAWYRLGLTAATALSPTARPTTTIFRTCAPPIVVYPTPVPVTLQVRVNGATATVGSPLTLGTQASPVALWFQLPGGKKNVTVALAVLTPGAGAVHVDDVTLSRVSAPPATTTSSSAPDATRTTGRAADGVLPLC